MTLKDDNYNGGIKFFHWSMALIFIWQFAVIIANKIMGDTPTTEWMWATHKPLGLLLCLLLVARITWGVITLKKRPVATSYWSHLGHLVLYILMALIPVLALIRQYGSGRSLEVFGVTVFEGFEGEKIEWMVALGNWFHGEIGIVLGLLIIGHIAMAFGHRRKSRSNAVFQKIM